MKAANLLISNDGSLRIADFGLARSYDPSASKIPEADQRQRDRRYTNCVVTRWYRPPELLLGARRYGGEIDMWGVGCVVSFFPLSCTYSTPERCVLGEMFHRRPILCGTSDLDQLEKIWTMCGTPNQQTWPSFDNLPGCDGIKHFSYRQRQMKSMFEAYV
jgi:serine/threonine-protein kinase BUR1